MDDVFTAEDPVAMVRDALAEAQPTNDEAAPLPPLDSQEVWAAGVTWMRSKTARMEESEAAGGSDFYDRVYHAKRPELFLKATPHRVVGDGATMRLRSDSSWIVPEPELTLAITSSGRIFGYTCGNDLSCRDIEGENPLYLPQAKTFDACAAIGPAILLGSDPLPDATSIHCGIVRNGASIFEQAIEIAHMKKKPHDLVPWLFRDNSHPAGCLLMTGTGIVPPDDLSLEPDDVVTVSIDGIGVLRNPMAAANS